MFKKIKESEAYEKYKEIKGNQQSTSIISLGFIIIFFIVMIAFVRTSNTSISNENGTISLKPANYEYTYSDNKVSFLGKRYDDKHLFIFNNNRYYYNGNSVYLIKDNTATIISDLNINYLKITPEMISNLTDSLNPTTNGNAKVYLVPLANFISLYELDTEVDLSGIMNYNIVVENYYKDDILYMSKLDLTNYYNYRLLENNGILTLTYYNMDNVNDFSENYDRMIGV